MRLRFCFCSHIHCVLLLSHLLLQPFTLCTRVCVCVCTPDCVYSVCASVCMCVCVYLSLCAFLVGLFYSLLLYSFCCSLCRVSLCFQLLLFFIYYTILNEPNWHFVFKFFPYCFVLKKMFKQTHNTYAYAYIRAHTHTD